MGGRFAGRTTKAQSQEEATERLPATELDKVYHATRGRACEFKSYVDR